MRKWTVATAALTAAVALSSGGAPWLHAVTGAFSPPDFAQDLAAARVALSGRDPYQVGIAEEHARILGGPPEIGYPFFPHPPLLLVLAAPLAHLELRQAASIWFAVSLTLLFVLAVLVAEIVSAGPGAGQAARSAGVSVPLVFAALLAWPPVLYSLEKGQWSILVALLLALSWRYSIRSRPREAGACVGLAAAIKLFPALLLAYLLLRTPRAALWAGLVVLAAFVVPLSVLGLRTVDAFLEQSRANVTYWETWPAATYSVHGALARALVGGQWARPFVHAPMLARGLEAVALLVCLGAAAVFTGRGRTDGRREGALYAAWIALLVALNPLAMGHNGVILTLPIVLAGLALADEQRIWPKVAWAAGVVLVSIPRQALTSAPPSPVGPWEGLALIALPLWGTLLLFIAGLAASARPGRDATRPA